MNIGNILKKSGDISVLQQNKLVIWLINDVAEARVFFESFLKSQDFYLKGERRIARGALYYFLLRYGVNEPLERTVHGKLFTENRIKFNITHTFRKVGLIFAKNIEVGIDLEVNFPRKNWKQIAKRFNFKAFTLKEFYAEWTRKEAEVKSRGAGIFSPNVNFQSQITENLILAENYSGAISYPGPEKKEFEIFKIL